MEDFVGVLAALVGHERLPGRGLECHRRRVVSEWSPPNGKCRSKEQTMKTRTKSAWILVWTCAVAFECFAGTAEDWPQLQGNALRSGNAPAAELQLPLGLVAAIPLTDAIFASPVLSEGIVFVVDGSGVVFAIDTKTLDVKWKFATRGGPGNCNNVAAPAVVGNYVHIGTMAGYYYVLDRDRGNVIAEIDCREPIFSAPVAGSDRVYFATLGARVYAVEPDGKLVWTWDFVKEVVRFDGNRWSGADWLTDRKDRVTWRDHFVCSRDICLMG
jgi:hypothetical protein